MGLIVRCELDQWLIMLPPIYNIVINYAYDFSVIDIDSDMLPTEIKLMCIERRENRTKHEFSEHHRIISITGFHIRVRQFIYIESGPWREYPVSVILVDINVGDV